MGVINPVGVMTMVTVCEVKLMYPRRRAHGQISNQGNGVGQRSAGRDHINVDSSRLGRLIEKTEGGVTGGRRICWSSRIVTS